MLLSELERLQDLLSSFLGQPKNPVSESCRQLQFPCPRCVDERGEGEVSKYNLEVTFDKCLFSSGGLFHCWSCCSTDDEMKGGVYKLIKKYGSRDILNDYKAIINEIRTQALYNIGDFSLLKDETVLDDYLTLPSTYTQITNLDKCNKRIAQYLNNRGFTEEIIKKYKIGYTLYGEDKPSVRNRIIIPSYTSNGDLSFWVGRDFTGNKKRVKYFNSPNVDKKDIIFQESHISWDSNLLLVEGAIDALMGPPNTTALLGKTLSRDSYLYNSIMTKLNANVIICLDGDTNINETKKIFLLLNHDRMRGRVKYITMENYKDMADAFLYGGKEEIMRIMSKQREFSEIELLTYID